MQFAGHICGSWVTELLLGRWPERDFLNIHKEFMSPEMFSRWQINTHGVPHKVDYRQLNHLIRQLANNDQSVIFQYDDVNSGLIQHSIEADNINIAALFDLSHGAGVLPVTWPNPLHGVACGYAGGLSPKNVAVQLERIAAIVGDRQVWIDAETKLRSRNDLLFDLKKVRAFLTAAEPWVV